MCGAVWSSAGLHPSGESQVIKKASIVTVIRLVNDAVDTIENEVSVMDEGETYKRAYHWDTSDWMPSTRLADTEEMQNFTSPPDSDIVGLDATPGGSTHELESDYYLGGYDVDSDYPPPHAEVFLSQDQLPPPLPGGGDCPGPYTPLLCNVPISMETILNTSSTRHQETRPHFHPSHYLPSHHLPTGNVPHRDLSTPLEQVSPVNGDFAVSLNMHPSVGTSSTCHISTPCVLDSGPGSSCEGLSEVCRGVTIITDSQQQTEV
ncbi:protocadherin Fat 3a isoform X19 [Fundulus heteroclitus]|uniref:protocadherin Fat 3a isoform X19 n=1 Tax=Fundulus heteroclitus TaxID=8078 RepID=UPI00165B42FB|nr:protocadherin Fat 3a isoform X19 [Fundulus heteroclitus]